MKKLAGFASIPLLLALLAGPPATGPVFAQVYAQQAPDWHQAGVSQAELDQMLAPIALYPDALLSQLLIATSYWPEVAEAARFSLENPQLDHEDALRVVETWSWHPSVKSLLALPQLLAMMGQRPDWVARLGDTFLVQQSRVMDTIQMLRQRAQAAGSLQSSTLINVVQQGPATLLLSPDPQLIYVPWYNANLVYGRWWWPSHPPLVWTAWSGGFGRRSHVPAGYPHVVALPTRHFVATFDWHRRAARMVHAERTAGLAHAPHVLPPSPAHRAGDGRPALPRSNFATAPAAHAGERPAPPAAGASAIDYRRHHPVPGAGQTRPPPPPAPAAVAAVATPAAVAAITTPTAATAVATPAATAAVATPAATAAVATPAATAAVTTPAAATGIASTHDQFARQRAQQPAATPAAVSQAVPPAPQAAHPGQTIGTPASGQAPLAGAHRAERSAGILRHEPLAQAPQAGNTAHGSRTEHATGIQRMESSGRPHSPGQAAMHPAGVQQTQRPQTIVPAVVPVISVAAGRTAAPTPPATAATAATARTPGNPGDSQQRARGPR